MCAAAGARTLGAQARTPEPTKDSALVAYDDDGLRIHTPDRKRQFKVRGYFVLDSRQVLNDTADASTNGFNIRRARVIFDANLFPGVAMRLMYDVGPISGPSALQDGYLDVGLGGGWYRLFAQQPNADHRGLAGGQLRGHPLLYHVQGNEQAVFVGDSWWLWHRHRCRRGGWGGAEEPSQRQRR